MEINIVLDQRIKSDDLTTEENYRPILIAHKLLNDELDRLIDEGRKANEADGPDDDDDDDLNDPITDRLDEEL